MSTNMLVDLAEALSLLSPPAEGHASSNAIQEEGELQQGKDTATAAPPGMAVWRQALDRLAEALAGRVDSMYSSSAPGSEPLSAASLAKSASPSRIIRCAGAAWVYERVYVGGFVCSVYV